MQRQEMDCYSLDEVKAKLSALSHEEHLKLEMIARLQAIKIHEEWGELLHEGLSRILTGARAWPRGVAVANFVSMVLKSLVSAEAKHRKTVAEHAARVQAAVEQSAEQPQPPVSDMDEDNGDLAESSVGSSLSPNFVHAVYVEEMLTKLHTKLISDPDALAVTMALAEGLKPSETRAEFKMAPGRYDAARKRASRVVQRLISEEDAQ